MAEIKNPLIFIVEDNKIYSKLIENYLEKKGFKNLKIFSSGEECLKNIDQKPLIIVQDYLLDGLNGIEVLKRAKNINPEIEFIFLSAQDSMEVAVNTMRYGAFDYIVKDEVTFDKLIDKISKILKIKSLQRTQKHFKTSVTLFFAGLMIVVLFFIIMLLSR